MKFKYKFLLLIILLEANPSITFAQSYGLDLGISTSSAYFLGGHICYNNLIYKFEVSIQSANTKGNEISEQKPNYGKIIEGSGDYFYSLDLGFGYLISQVISINSILSIARRKYYINYIDNRFSEGGYHMINEEKIELGIGISSGFSITENLSLLVGYHSLRDIFMGMSLNL